MVSNLTELATTAAILIDTGDASRTPADLSAAIERIRRSSITCDAAIPPTPAGMRFDPALRGRMRCPSTHTFPNHPTRADRRD